MNAVTELTNPEKKRVEEQPKKIAAKDFLQSEFAYARFSVTLPVGWTIDDVLRPECWTNVAHVLARQPMTGEPEKIGTIVEIRTVDHAFYAEVYVRAVRERSLEVALIGDPVYFGSKNDKTSGEYRPRWNVGAQGFDIVRVADGAIVGNAKEFKIKEDALAYIRDVLKG